MSLRDLVRAGFSVRQARALEVLVPAPGAGDAGKVPTVNDGENGYTLVLPAPDEDGLFLPVPAGGDVGKTPAVNESENGYVLTAPAAGGGALVISDAFGFHTPAPHAAGSGWEVFPSFEADYTTPPWVLSVDAAGIVLEAGIYTCHADLQVDAGPTSAYAYVSGHFGAGSVGYVLFVPDQLFGAFDGFIASDGVTPLRFHVVAIGGSGTPVAYVQFGKIQRLLSA